MPLIPSALVGEADSTEQMSDKRTIVQDLRPLDGKHSTTQYSSLREVNMDGTDTQKHHFLAFGDTGPIQKRPIRTGESSLANASGPVVDLGLRAQQGSPRCRDSPPFSVPTGPSPPRTPRFNSPHSLGRRVVHRPHGICPKRALAQRCGPSPQASTLETVPGAKES